MQLILLPRGLASLVDDEDVARVGGYTWTVCKSAVVYYAYSTVKNADGTSRTVQMHRLIVDAPECAVVDHINGFTLDNRKENLRVSTHAQNGCNKHLRPGRQKNSRFKGVCSVSGINRWGLWKAMCCVGYKVKSLGTWSTEECAALAYDVNALAMHGDFASINGGLIERMDEICAAEIAASPRGLRRVQKHITGVWHATQES